jgi:hypothetical protein
VPLGQGLKLFPVKVHVGRLEKLDKELKGTPVRPQGDDLTQGLVQYFLKVGVLKKVHEGILFRHCFHPVRSILPDGGIGSG